MFRFLAAIAILLLLSSIATTINISAKPKPIPTNRKEVQFLDHYPSGATADIIETTRAFLSFSPTTIGVGQTLLVNLWLNPALHVSRYFSDYAVTITSPSGETEVIKKDSYRILHYRTKFEYVPTEVGTYKLKFDFPGGYFPPGNYTIFPGAFVGANVVNFNESIYYQPSSTPEQYLTVQQDMVPTQLLQLHFQPITGLHQPLFLTENGGQFYATIQELGRLKEEDQCGISTLFRHQPNVEFKIWIQPMGSGT